MFFWKKVERFQHSLSKSNLYSKFSSDQVKLCYLDRALYVLLQFFFYKLKYNVI